MGNCIGMVVKTINWLLATTGMKIDPVLDMKQCICLSGEACDYGIVLRESGMTTTSSLNYHDI